MSQQSGGRGPSRGVGLNVERGRAAVLGGLAALALFALAFVVFVVAAATGIGNPVFGGRSEPGTGAYAAMLVVTPAIVILGAALPARALGAGWPRSLLASVAALAILVLSLYTGSGTLTAVVAALTPAIVTLLTSAGGGLALAGLWAVLAVSTALLILAILGLAVSGSNESFVVFAICSFAWVVVPATAGLFQPRRG